MKSKVVIPCGLVLVFLLSTTMPVQFLEDVVYPKEVSTARETLTFDEIGTHETRRVSLATNLSPCSKRVASIPETGWLAKV